jgi:hypothetical protein
MGLPWHVAILTIESKEYRLVTSTAEVREILGNAVVFDDGSTFDLLTNVVQDKSVGALEGTVLVDSASMFYVDPIVLVSELFDRTVLIGIMPDGTIVMHKLYEGADDTLGLATTMRQVGSAT